MSEKKSRVSKYQRIHVDVEEFKKQQVVNAEGLQRLQKLQSVNVKIEDGIVDVDKTASTKKDMELMKSFAKEASDAKTPAQRRQKNVFVVEEIDNKEVVEVKEPVVTEIVEKDEVVVANATEATTFEEKEEIKPVKKAKKAKKTWKERWFNFGMGFFTFCNVCALICFFVVYGPFHQIRDMYVTTAMSTMTKKFLANVLYDTETIQEVLATNITIEPNEVMDQGAISIGQISEPTMYSSIYEEQVLKRGEGEDLYKIVRLDENGYEGYVVFVYDPTRINVATTRTLGTIYGEFVTDIAKRANAEIAINGGGFITSGQPSGYVYQNGKIIWSRDRGGKWAGGTIGFTKEGVMILTKSKGQKALDEGVYNGVDFGPFLIVNGKSAEVSGNGGWGVNPRTVIGQRKDGIVVILIIDGRSRTSLGIDLNTAIEIMERYDVYNAANLDGGSSTTLVVKDKIINNPTSTTNSGQRYLPIALVVTKE